MQDTQNPMSDTQESINPPVWFNKEYCTICSVGVTSRMQQLIDSGMSERKASRIMSDETEGEVSPDVIRKRFSYYTKPVKKTDAELGETSHLQEVVTENSVNAELGETSHLQEVVIDDTQGFVIPLHVDQTALIEALADCMIDKQIPVKAMESTIERAIFYMI